MKMDAEPRWLLKPTYDVKEFWSRILLDEFAAGGWIATTAPKFQREHLLWALSLVRHVNGRTGETFISNAELAEKLGYAGNNHPGPEAVEVLTRMGFFTANGKRGRARVLKLSVPEYLITRNEYSNLVESTMGELILGTTYIKPTPPGGTKKEVVRRKGEEKSPKSEESSSKYGEWSPEGAEVGIGGDRDSGDISLSRPHRRRPFE
ncbi:hypothetical protein [Streptomyces hundungensis]|uniref:hypothetical protein n=1 Tax=Streptomyces hundungensis TaxID=1077946 RepID=UPI0033EA977A